MSNLNSYVVLFVVVVLALGFYDYIRPGRNPNSAKPQKPLVKDDQTEEEDADAEEGL